MIQNVLQQISFNRTTVECKVLLESIIEAYCKPLIELQ